MTCFQHDRSALIENNKSSIRLFFFSLKKEKQEAQTLWPLHAKIVELTLLNIKLFFF